jgi:hypothetical protein
MVEHCSHLDTVGEVTPWSDGCEDCLTTGGRWVHLRMACAATSGTRRRSTCVEGSYRPTSMALAASM